MSSLYLIYNEIYIAKVLEKLKGDQIKDEIDFFLSLTYYGPTLNKPLGFYLYS